MAGAITLRKLSKRYAGTKVYALHNVSLEVASGEVYGFLGANGAGKSTTIRTLLNFIQPTSGAAQILGKDIVRDSVEIKRHVGYLAGDAAFYPKMTGKQFLEYMADLQPPKHREYVRHLLKVFEADVNKPIKTLSKGNRQKFGVIQALMHEPEVVILDEPTSGLDPLMQDVFYDEIRTIARRGGSVFFSSHNLAEVQRACDKVAFIRGGKLVAEQSIDDLAHMTAQTFDITFVGNAPLTALKTIRGARVTALRPNHVTVHMRGELTPLFAVLARSRVQRLEKPVVTLEDEFLKFYHQPSGKEQAS